MNDHRWFQFKWLLSLAIVTTMVMGFTIASGADLKEVKERGVLRHLGIPYANFITGSGDQRLFAAHLGLRYEFITITWEHWTEDLIGRKVEFKRDGSYFNLVTQYYPNASIYFPDFFKE